MREVEEQESVAELRGLGCQDTNEELLLVQAPIATASETFARFRPDWERREDVFGPEGLEVSDRWGCLIYQLRGHTWTVIQAGEDTTLSDDEAQALSERLSTEALFLGLSDTASVVGYRLYQDGRMVEEFSYGGSESEGRPRLKSKLRRVEREDLGNPWEFVSEFLADREAYVPGCGYYDELASEFEAEDFERVDELLPPASKGG
jgi:hypothetical protein